MRQRLIIILILTNLSMVLFSQQVDTCAFKIGTNLAGPVDWGSEWPFKDIMKYSRTWGTQNIGWYSGGQNPWDSNLADSVLVDADGYPLELPFFWPGQDTSQTFYTVWANTASLPAGTYICLYDGQGVIDFSFDASIISQSPGRIKVSVTPGVDDIMQMKILQSQAGNHIRNIRFLLPGTEFTYMLNPYNATWLEKLSPFDYLRFMDWGHTNNSTLRHWYQRPKVNDYTYTAHGAPYEEMIRICNYKQADAWVCVPHLADSNYILQMATLFRDSLDPGLRIYVEYSNELWNWMFDQAHYGVDSLDQSIPWPERLGPKIGSVMEIWSQVFSGQINRIRRVCGVQIGWMDVAIRTMSNVPASSIDLVSPTSYVGLDGDSLDYYGASLTLDKVFELAWHSLYVDIARIKELYHYADSIGYDGIVYYEGGQHFTPNPFGSIQPYNDTLVAAQTDQRMYDLYAEMFDSLRAVTGTDSALFMNFSFIGQQSGQYGSWGALESQFYQFPPYNVIAPKYQALLDNIYNCNLVTSTETNPGIHSSIQIYPNPCTDFIFVELAEKSIDVNACMFDIYGRKVLSVRVINGKNIIRFNDKLISGIYLLKLSGTSLNHVQKIMVK